VSHVPADECDHLWTHYETQERKMFTSSDDVIFKLVRQCTKCGLVDEGTRDP